MFFKFTRANPYRDLAVNLFKIAKSDLDSKSKYNEYSKLMNLMKRRLKENEAMLCSQAAFATRCQHWNQREVSSIKPVKTQKNPWLNLKREVKSALRLDPEKTVIEIEKSLTWFSVSKYKEDWIVDAV